MYYIKYKELLYITKCDRKYNYIHFKNGKTLVKDDLLIEDDEMVMIQMLADFIIFKIDVIIFSITLCYI